MPVRRSPHLAPPTTAGVAAGDRVFPLAFKGGRLMVLCECEVEQIVPVEDFCERFCVAQRPSWQSEYLRDWLAARSCPWLAPTCTDEAILPRSCTPLAFGRFVPLDQVPGMRMLNSRGERPLTNVLPDGRLRNANTLHGRYYRASPAAAEVLSTVARAAPTGSPGVLW